MTRYPRNTTIAGALILVGATFGIALAGGHTPVEQREAAMKTMGASAKTLGEMVKGETDFDAAKANETLVAMQSAVANLGELFPEGTELAGSNENAAGPQIWTDRAGFDAAVLKFQTSIDAGVAAAPASKEELATAFGAISENCGACHKAYRVKK